MPYKIDPKRPPSKARQKWEKTKRGIGSVVKGALGGAAAGAAAGSVVPGIGTALGALGGLSLGSGAGVTQGIQQYNDRDVFGNQSNINSDLQGINPNATRHNENVDINKLNPEAKAEWQKEQQKPGWAEILKKVGFGEEGKELRLDTLDPAQRQLFNDQILPYIINQIGQSNKSLEEYGQEFEPFAQQARQEFNQKTIPTIAERFGALGRTPSGSGAFRNALQDTAQNFDTQLKSQQAQYALKRQQGQKQHTLGAIGQGLGRQYDTKFTDPTQGLIQPLLGVLGKVGAAYYGARGNQSEETA